MNEQAIEQEIQAKGLNAPRITPDDIDAAISSEQYFTAADGCLGDWQYRRDINGVEASGVMQAVPESLHLLTFCVLRNGFTVTGESACASPENFNAEIGRKIARENAKQKIWALEGYLLKQKLSGL